MDLQGADMEEAGDTGSACGGGQSSAALDIDLVEGGDGVGALIVGVRTAPGEVDDRINAAEEAGPVVRCAKVADGDFGERDIGGPDAGRAGDGDDLMAGREERCNGWPSNKTGDEDAAHRAPRLALTAQAGGGATEIVQGSALVRV
jgi:hypothetical protein